MKKKQLTEEEKQARKENIQGWIFMALFLVAFIVAFAVYGMQSALFGCPFGFAFFTLTKLCGGLFHGVGWQGMATTRISKTPRLDTEDFRASSSPGRGD